MIRTRILRTVGLLVSLSPGGACFSQNSSSQTVLSTVVTPNSVTKPLVGTQMLTTESGWARTDRNLFVIKTAGRHWTDITPPMGATSQINAVHFFGADHAWVLSHGYDVNQGSSIDLAVTGDGGVSWSTAPFPVSQFLREGYGAAAEISFPDATHGWVLLRLAGSSASSLGSLFVTTDGGKTWSPLPYPPVYGHMQFVSESTGWLAGGVHRNLLYRTHDGGQTWLEMEAKVILPDDITPYSIAGGLGTVYVEEPFFFGPRFETPEAGVIALTVRISELTEDFLSYSTAGGGESWQLTTRRNNLQGLGPIVLFDSTSLEVTRSGSSFDFIRDNAKAKSAAIPSSVAKEQFNGVETADFIDARHGWFVSGGGSLLGTADGGSSVKILLQAAPPPSAKAAGER